MKTPPSSLRRIALFAATLVLPLQAQLTSYTPMPGGATSAHFTLTVNGQSVPVETLGDPTKVGYVSYARFSFLGTASLQVSLTSGTINAGTATVSPISYGYNGAKTIAGANLSFSIDRPSTLVVKINDLENLLLFADGPELDAPPSSGSGIANVSAYLDSPDPYASHTTLNYAFNAAIAALTSNGGGVLYVPNGLYTLGQLTLPANIHLYLESGARLLAIDDPTNFSTNFPAQNGSDSSFIYITGSNVTISGRGVIDGNGYNLRDYNSKDAYNVKLIRAKGSNSGASLTNLQIKDVYLRDSARWTVHLYCTDNSAVRRVKIINDMTVWPGASGRSNTPYVSNTDGFDIDGCANVLIDGCFIYTTDDALTPKVTNNFAVPHPAKPSTGHTLINNVIYNQKAGLKVGDELRNDMSDVFLGNNDMVVSDRFLCLWAAPGVPGEPSRTISNIRTINNRVETVGYPGENQRVFWFNLTVSGYTYDSTHLSGNIDNIEVNGLYGGNKGNSSRLNGNALSPGYYVSNVAIKNTYLNTTTGGTVVDSAADLPFASYDAYHTSLTVTTPGGTNMEINNGAATSPFNTVTNVAVATDLPVVEVRATDDWAKEGVDTGTFVFSRSGSLTSALTVYYTVSGTATSGTDYTAIGTSVTFASGEQQKFATVIPAADTPSDDGETVTVTLTANAAYSFYSGATSTRAPTSATITIADAPPPIPTVTAFASDNAASENGDDGVFTVTRTGSTAAALTVYFTLSGGATNGTDYATVGSSVTIPSGQASADVVISPIIDGTSESTETVVLTLNTNAAYIVGSPSTDTVNLADVPMISVTVQDGFADETQPLGNNSGRFKIARTGSTTAALSVNFTLSGVAINGTDYVSVTSPVSIPAGSSYVWVYITPYYDGLSESSESVIMTATASTAYGIDPAHLSASFTITNTP